MIQASVYQMTRGFLEVSKALFSCIYLKRTVFTANKLMGVFFVAVGVTLVGIAGYIIGQDGSQEGNMVLGMLCVLTA